MKHLYKFVGLWLVTFALPLSIFAGTTGKISGRITDGKTKEALPGVNVRVEGTTLGAVTNVEGRYVILNVQPGRVTVTASFIGYKKHQVKDIRVSSDFTTTLDIVLEQGDIELDAVVVQGERSPLIRKDLTNPVASVSSEAIAELPVTSIDQIIGLQAGTTVDDDGSIHIRGGYGNEIAYTLNGININNPYANSRSVGLATNAVQEVSISSGTFNAEYGSALSGVVNYVTKDGGSNLSFGLKYYTGDNVSNHTSPFFNIDKINPVNVNRTEATIGGPIIEDVLSFYGSGVYNWNGGYLYGIRLYKPEDGYLSREGFPSADPRRGTSSDPLYFGPLRNGQSDLVGLPSGDGAIVPLNWSRSYNLQGNLSLRVSSDMKLKYEIVYDNDLRPRNSGNSSLFNSRYRPDGRNLNAEKGWFHSVEWTHSPSTNFFYTIKGSYITNEFTSRAYESATDPRYLPSFYLAALPGTSFLTGGTDLYRQLRKTKTISGKIDAVAQLWDIHEFKAGFEFRSHRIDNTEYTLSFVNPVDRTSVTISDALNGKNYVPYVSLLAGGESEFIGFDFKPLQLAAYLQDKIELFQSIILNLGLRYDYFDPAARYNPQLSQEFASPDSNNNYGKNSIPAKKKHMLSPRFSVSYPITDQGTIRFSYGHFYQLGSLSSVYQNPYYYGTQNSTPTFGNANVDPQRSVQYELGLQQGLTDNLKIEITGYYKDVRDYIYSQRILAGNNGDLSYRFLTNLNYANTRGVSISLLKRRSPGDIFSATVDYTFQIADGNRTEPVEEMYFSEKSGQLSETYLVPFSFDRSHTITSTVTLNQPDDWSVSAIGYVRTGTPYTPSFPSGIVPITFVQNSDRQTMQWNVDLKVEKYFNFSDMEFSLFVQVDNVFDTKNETSVYVNSGRALYNIEQVINPARFSSLRDRISRGQPGLIPMEALDSYYANPGNLSQPRLVRLGASFNF